MSVDPCAADAPYAADGPSLTPFNALYEALRRSGWVSSKAGFARMLRLNEGNVYHYLAEPTSYYRLASKASTIHAAAWAISQSTGIQVTVLLHPSGEMDLEIHGKTSQGDDITPYRFKTLYHKPFRDVRKGEPYTCDFTVARPWLPVWEEGWNLSAPTE